MSNEIGPSLEKSDKNALSVNRTYINNSNGLQVGHADNVSAPTTVNVIIPGGDAKRNPLNSNYYNLIIGFDPFEKNRLLITYDRALQRKEYLTDENAELFSKWDENTIDRIKKLPAVIAMEYMGQPKKQQAALAILTDIRPQENGIVVYFQIISTFLFQKLIDNRFDFGIGRVEIYRTHWTIKTINLIEVLEDLDIPIIGGAING